MSPVSRAMYGKRHNQTALSHPGKGIGDSLTFSWRLATDPGFALGVTIAAVDMTIGTLVATIQGKPAPSLHYRNGGYLVKNSVFFEQIYSPIREALGVNIGGTAFVPRNASKDTILHEVNHTRQYRNKGFLRMTRWGMRDKDGLERDNDYMGLTYGYGRIFEYLFFAQNNPELQRIIFLRYFYLETKG